MAGRASTGITAARWFGPLGLVVFGVVLLVPDEAIALRAADIGLGLMIALALGTHWEFHRRWRRDGSAPGGQS